MAISLREERLLTAAQEALLSALEYETVEAWALEAARRVQDATGGDRAGITFPGPDRLHLFAADYRSEVAANYAEAVRPLHQRVRFLDRGVELGAWDRRRLWGAYFDSYVETPYYNEFVVPYRLFDTVGLAAATTADIQVETVAQLLVTCDVPRGRDYQEAALAQLRLLLPAFRSAVRIWLCRRTWQDGLQAVIDTLPEAFVVCNRAGRIVHRNPSLAAIVEADQDGVRVLAAAGHLARSLVPRNRFQMELLPATTMVSTRRADYRLSLLRVPEDFFGPGTTCLVRVECSKPALDSTTELCERWGLTDRQAQVALLLADRKTNREVASILRISLHTAKRHTEKVLLKLNITSRDQVQARLRPRGWPPVS